MTPTMAPTSEKYIKTISSLERNKAQELFGETLNNKLRAIRMHDTFQNQAEQIVGLHRTLYSFQNLSKSDLVSFESEHSIKLLDWIDKELNKTPTKQDMEFRRELGKRLNRLAKEYSAAIVKAKESLNKLESTVQDKRFVANSKSNQFSREDYIAKITANIKEIPKALEKSLPYAVTQFPDNKFKDKIRNCVKLHRSLESFLDTDTDKILRFESMATSYYLETIYAIVTVPQSVADTADSYDEVLSNLNTATDDYTKAMQSLVDKMMTKKNIDTKTKLNTLRDIVEKLV